ncbi:MAG: O-antigen ligase family protein [bacterium]
MQIKNINLNKIVEYIFYSFIFLLPWQTRWIYQYGQLNGGQWEYGTLSLFGTEILLWAIFLLSLFLKNRRSLLRRDCDGAESAGHKSPARESLARRLPRGIYVSIILFIVYFLTSIFWSLNKTLTIYSIFHIIEALILIYLILKIKLDYKKLFYAILASAFIQAVLGIYQFSNQFVSANKWLGIASQNPSELGVSVVGTEWCRWLRAYGSFTHPNILAGFFALGFLVGLYLIINHKVENKKQLYGKLILVLTNLIIFLGLLLTFSRSAWISLFIVMLVCCYSVFRKHNKIAKNNLKLFLFYCLLLTTLIVFVFKDPFLSRTSVVEQRLESKSTTERLAYYKDSLELIKKNFILGVGAGNYTLAVHDLLDSSRQPSWVYQPVHNVFVLFFVEMGAVGFLLFLYLLFKIVLIIKNGGSTSKMEVQPPREFIIYFLLLILFLGLFDHYLWTSYFGLMLLGIIIGILVKKREND